MAPITTYITLVIAAIFIAAPATPAPEAVTFQTDTTLPSIPFNSILITLQTQPISPAATKARPTSSLPGTKAAVGATATTSREHRALPSTPLSLLVEVFLGLPA
ncbi:hypothetical protein P280DRAFT_528193 [Massarina eburnea CBS 473.64]|uniref:Uncharacterized protein n=1 Tax=Massarina eburnea CBS 473.64 TaxID=1395130 RepID=A0A6A6RU16_9PLEO|nr:hypothetical protein P280DRAFT_528193 [Massarina eburnea CBS 473.64]